MSDILSKAQQFLKGGAKNLASSYTRDIESYTIARELITGLVEYIQATDGAQEEYIERLEKLNDKLIGSSDI